MRIAEYLHQVIMPILSVTLLSLPLPFIIRELLDESIWTSLLVIMVCVVSAALSIFFVGLTATEKAKLISSIKQGVSKIQIKK